MIGGFCAFTAYSLMPLADAYAFIFATPLLITVLSVPLLGETVRWRRWSAVLVGFAGVLIMLQPGNGSFDLAAGAALAAATASALSIILVRKLSATETTASIAFYTNAAVAVVMACLLPIGFVPPSLADLALMALAGLTGGAALMLLIAGYRRAQAAVVAPFQYSQMLWGVLLGWLLWDDLPSTAIALGATIVVASGLYILYREVVRAEGRLEPVTASPAARRRSQRRAGLAGWQAEDLARLGGRRDALADQLDEARRALDQRGVRGRQHAFAHVKVVLEADPDVAAEHAGLRHDRELHGADAHRRPDRIRRQERLGVEQRLGRRGEAVAGAEHHLEERRPRQHAARPAAGWRAGCRRNRTPRAPASRPPP